MRILVFLMLAAIASPAYSQITIGRYRVNGTIEFDADLTIEEVVPMTTIPDPVAFWPCDDLNSSVGDYDLTNNNDVTFGAGKLGDAAQFDGTNYLSIPNADCDRLKVAANTFADGWTLVGWVKPTATPALFTRPALIGNANSRDSGIGWQLLADSGFGNLDPVIVINGTSINFFHSMVLNQWNFVAVRSTVATGQSHMYINSTTPVRFFNSYFSYAASTEDFVIGGAHGGARLSVSEQDAWAFFDTALSDAALAALYNNGDGRELPIVTNATSFIPTYGTPALALATYGTSAAPIATMGVSKQ